jgi:hypothetical protein
MQLINIKTGCVIVEYKESATLFYDPFLEREMKMKGICIPPYLRSAFEGKSVIRFKDKEFQRAFKDVYAQAVFNSPIYQWCLES